MERRLQLGIDTGGTFTDAVVIDAEGAILGTAKAPTTRDDLAIGIRGAVTAALASAGRAPDAIGLVGLSTTLATNAIVEGHGGRVGLVMIGFEPAQMARADLARALGADPFLLIAGGHSAFGDEAAPLDLGALERFVGAVDAEVEAYAVAAMFSVRNPAHETLAAARLAELTGRPVSTSHGLARALDGPRRALTALLNARLVPIIADLIRRTEAFLVETGIAAPLMVVRGNGALMAAAEARARPVETVLSGPAASAVGAGFLTGLDHAVIADIGGTTTDVGALAGGLPAIDPDGASVGGYRTMVEAIRMTTVGLGGDSEVWVEDAAPVEAGLALGPRRVIPIAALATACPEIVHRALDLQLMNPVPGVWDGRFAMMARGVPLSTLAPAEREFIAALESGPKPLGSLIRSQVARGTLTRFVARGAITLAGLTPTDAAHILRRQTTWDAEASRKAAQLFLRRRNRLGKMHAPTVTTLAEAILDRLVMASADFILQSCAELDGIPADGLAGHPLARRALDRQSGLLAPSIRLTVPLVGLGAAASLHYPAIAARLGARSVIPQHAGVANAIGAVVGHVRREARVLITQPWPGCFRLHLTVGTDDHASYESAIAAARDAATREALAQLRVDGAETGDVRVAIAEKIAETGGEAMLIEAEVVATATGRPAARRAVEGAAG